MLVDVCTMMNPILYSKAIDPPKIHAIDAAWKTLQDLGAVEGEDHKSRLTALGRHVGAALSCHS